MFSAVARAVLVLIALAILAVLAWPEALGLQNTWVVAHAVSLRGLAVVVALVLLAVLAIVLLLARKVRGTTAALMGLLVLFGGVNIGVLLHRGVDAGAVADAGAESTTSASAVTVLSWNTLGDAPGAQEIADLAVAEGADVVTLPETRSEERRVGKEWPV